MITIESPTLQAKIKPTGAELSSLYSKASGKEYIWQGNPTWWTGQAPILFPNIGFMKDNMYNHNGISYEIPKHGFVRNAEFCIQQPATQDLSKATFTYSSNEATRKIYPFEFMLSVEFELVANALSITYHVKSTSQNIPMYFSIGAHEAYNCPIQESESFEDYFLEFDKTATYTSNMITSSGILSTETYNVIENGHILPLNHALFQNDAIVIQNVPSSRVFLRSKKSNTAIEINYHDAPNLGIWTKVGAPYICIEPWYGLPDSPHHNGNIIDKPGIIALSAQEEFSWTHTITIHDKD